MIYGKIENEIAYYQYVDNKTEQEIEELKSLGYKEVTELEKPKDFDHKLYILYNHLIKDNEDNYIMRYELICNYRKISLTIKELKQQLSTSDYKVIKNVEAQMLGLDLPYNPTELNFERQPLRDKINELEKLLEDRGIVAQ